MATPELGPGNDSKGNAGTWKRNAAGKLIFVARASKATTPVLSADRFAKWSPEHQRESLKFYGGGLTPEDFLKKTPAEKRQILERIRVQGKAANAPDSVERPQTLGDIYRAAEQAGDVKYGGAERELNSEIGTSPAQQQRITDWFAQYQKVKGDIDAQTNAQYDAALTNATTLKTATNDKAAADTKARADAAAADAAARGTTVDPNVKAQADTAAANRSALVDAIATVIGGQKANAVNYQGTMKGVIANQELGEHNRENSRLNDLKSKLRDLLTDKGAFEGATRQDLLSNERKNQLEQATLRSQILNIATDADTAKANREQTSKDKAAQRSENRKTHYGPGSPVLNKYGFNADDWDALSESEKNKYREGKKKPGKKATPKTGPGSVTPAKEQEYVGKINSYLSQFKNPPMTWVDQADHTKGQRKMTKDEVYKGLLAAGADERIVFVADSLFRNKSKLGPNGLKNAHALGIHVNGRWKVLGQTKPSASNYGGGAGAGSGVS